MSKVAKLERDDLPAHGSNSGALLKKYVENCAKIEDKIVKLRGELKDELSSAKDDGFLKMAIRGAVKMLRMSEEQRQSAQSIQDEIDRITELCADLPLFNN